MFATPIFSGYTRLLDTNIIQRNKMLAEDLCKEYNMEFWDYSIENDFDINMYDYNGDLNHLSDAVENVDLVFVALHGGDGENGQIQSIFETHGIKYTGSNSKSSKLAMDKKELFKGMKALGINLQVHYLPVYRQPFYQKNFGYKSGDYPVAEKFYDRAISIPLYPRLTDAKVEKVVEDIKRFVESR